MSACSKCGSQLDGNPAYCPSCGAAVETSAGHQPSANAERGAASLRKPGMILLLLLVIGLIVYLIYINPSAHPVIKGQPVVSQTVETDTGFIASTPVRVNEKDDYLTIPLDDVIRYRIARFEYQTPTTRRAVIAYLTPEGKVVTAMSVSEHCGSTDFKLKGSHIYCAQCPSHWDMTTMEAYACCGKYFPDPIPSDVMDGNIRIQKKIVENWAGRL